MQVLADRICDFVNIQLSKEEWLEFVGDGVPYQEMCD
jgi:hypothetical protein